MSSTFTATASSLKHTKSSSSSTWQNGAFQGTYTGGYPRVGGMLFSTLRNVNWSEQIIEGIKFKFKFDEAGHRRAKKISLYRATRNSFGGTGSAFRGASIGSVTTSGDAYNKTLTVTASGSTLTKLIDMLQNSSINMLCIYTSESIPGSDTYSENYLRINAADMIITYSPKGSSGTLDKSTVPAGEEITLTVTPLGDVDQDTLTHTVEWKMGDRTEVRELAAGELEDVFTVPMAWLETIPSATSGGASCTITTIATGTVRGSRTYNFTVTAPESAAPTFDAVIAPAGQVTAGYYQYLSAAQISAANAAAQYGATITAYSITGSEGASGTTAALTTAAFQTPGAHAYTIKVTDSRGMIAEKTVSCDVIAVQLPTVSLFEAERYSAIQGDTLTYIRTDYGPNVWFNISMSIDPVDGHNAAEAYILYGRIGATERTRVDLPMGYALNVTNDRTIIPGEISANDGWEFTLYLSDKANGTVAYDLVSKGTCILHRSGNGYGLGVGGFVTDGTEEKPLFKSFWESHFLGGIAGVTNYVLGESLTGGVWIDGKPIYRMVLTNNVQIVKGTTTYINLGLPANSIDTVIRYEGYGGSDKVVTNSLMMPAIASSDGAKYITATGFCLQNQSGKGVGPELRVSRGTDLDTIPVGLAVFILEYTKN